MKKLLLAAALLCGTAPSAWALMPVIDAANLAQAQQVAANTLAIMQSNQQIQLLTQQVLNATTGNRTSQAGQFGSLGLGSGFNVTQAPNLGSIMSTGMLSWGTLGSSASQTATSLINGLNLVQSLSGLLNGTQTTQDKSYTTAVNTATALAALIAATQGASQTRQMSFQAASSQIGQAGDLKGSIDQNSQLVVQGSQTMNEMIGAINNVLTAQNVRNTQDIALQSSTAEALSFDGSKVTFNSQ